MDYFKALMADKEIVDPNSFGESYEVKLNPEDCKTVDELVHCMCEKVRMEELEEQVERFKKHGFLG